MKKLLLFVSIVCGVFAFLPAGPSTTGAAGTTVPATCVVVNGPNGLHVQAGYAPTGPDTCQQL